jgi:hypothetical protein
MRLSSESVSNEIDESDLQSEKHDEQRICIQRGIVIDLRKEEANTFCSIRITLESISREIDGRDLRPENRHEQRILDMTTKCHRANLVRM